MYRRSAFRAVAADDRRTFLFAIMGSGVATKVLSKNRLAIKGKLIDSLARPPGGIGGMGTLSHFGAHSKCDMRHRDSLLLVVDLVK